MEYAGPALVAAANASKLDDYHVHYFLDEDATPYIGTALPVPQGDPYIIHSGDQQVTFDNVAPGQHTLTVLLTGANHVSTVPPISSQITFTAT
jgi:hypothetical protein